MYVYVCIHTCWCTRVLSWRIEYESFAFCPKLECIKEQKQIRKQYLQNLLKLALMIWVLYSEIVKRVFLCLVATSVTVPWSLTELLKICEGSRGANAVSSARPWPGYHQTQFCFTCFSCIVLYLNVVPEPFPWATATCWHLLEVHCWPVFCSSEFWGQKMFPLVSPACFVCEADTAGLWRTRPPCIPSLL